jgi:hypothetical protein
MAEEHADEHGDHGEHDHGTLTYQGAEVTDATLAQMRELHPTLAENLDLTKRFADLTPEEKEKATLTQRKVEGFATWTPGYHSAGDRCAACGKLTEPLFSDRFAQGVLSYGAFVANVPVHPTRECIAAFARANPIVSAQKVDRLRREFTKDTARPTASITQFFRHDVLTHPPFGLEDWANSVAAANEKGLDKGTMRDMERLMGFVHRKLFHH